jgi:hypothetical protein
MSTIRIDEQHNRLLETLLAHLQLRGKKITKKEMIGILIEDALKTEGISTARGDLPVEQDAAWIGMDETFHTGIKDLSERVDEFLYGPDKDE